MVRAKSRKQWPIRQWISGFGNRKVGGFIVEDDEGYNFSFDTRKDAEEFRSACDAFNEAMDEKEPEIVLNFRRSLRA